MMDDPTPPVTPPADQISAFLAKQANEAMQAGANPQQVTAKLGQMVAHLRANPDIHTQANEAITKGMDPLAVATHLSTMPSTTLSTGKEAPSGFINAAERGATFGLSDKGGAAADAFTTAGRAKIAGSGDFFPTLKSAYLQNVEARKNAASKYASDHPYLNADADLGGGLANIVMTGGLGELGAGTEAAANVPRLTRWGQAIKAGTKYGALNATGRSNALEEGRGATGLAKDAATGGAMGAATGAASIPASGVAGWALGKTPIPAVLSKLLTKGGATDAGAALGTSGVPSQRIARAAGMDAEAGFTPEPMHPSVPSMALDHAGPNVQGLAEGIANKPGPGGAQLQGAVGKRLTLMRPAVTSELEKGSGVAAGDRLGPLQAAVDARTAEAKQLYDEARASTQGQAITSPTFEAITKTKAGAQALKAAMQRQGNMFHEAPTAGGTPPGMSPEQWAGLQATMKERGMTMAPGVEVSGDTPQADPETLHIMKQQLSKMAKLGDVNDPMTAEAHSLLPMIEKVKGELPDAWRKADAAFAERSRIIDMMDRGRQVYGTKLNPTTGHVPATGQKAVNMSLDGLKAKLAAASPAEQEAAQAGAATAAHARLLQAPSSMRSPGTVFNASPEVAEQTAHAFPTPEKAADFQHAVGSWDRVQAQSERMTGGSPTARRMANVGEADVLRPGDVAARSPRMVLRRVINAINDEAEAGANQKTNTAVAKILTDPKQTALADASKVGNLRASLLQKARLGVAGSSYEGGKTLKEAIWPTTHPPR